MGKPSSQCLRKIPMIREYRDGNYFLIDPQSDFTSLQWPKWKKTMILVICSLYSFLSNTALLGPAVYITIFAEDLHVSPVKASQLISYPTLVYGMGTLVTVPMYLKFGRRPILLGSIVIYEAELLSEIDLIDSRMEIYAEALQDLPAGSFSNRIFALDKKIYRHG